MAWTQTDVDRLKAAIAQGVRSVTYSDGRKHEYFSVAEMMRVLDMMQREVAGPAAAGEPRAVLVARDAEW